MSAEPVRRDTGDAAPADALCAGDTRVYALPGDAPPLRPGAAALLLVPPGAQPDARVVLRAEQALARSPRPEVWVDFAADADAPSALLDLLTHPERLGALMIPSALWARLPHPLPAAQLARAHVALRAAMAHELRVAPEPLARGGRAATPDPLELGAFHASAVRAFAAEDLYPELRESPPALPLATALLDWAARMLANRADPDAAFALGEYATSLSAGRNRGCGPRLGPRPSARPGRGDPLVSIIVPTCDRLDLLPRALESIEAQTWQDLEVILVSDGRTDPASVAAPFRERIAGGGRLTWVQHDRTRGAAAARNTGLRLARGRYVGFLDDDDRLLPHHCEVLLSALGGGARLARSDTRAIEEERADDADLPVTQAAGGVYACGFEWTRFCVDNSIPIQSVLTERELLRQAGGFDEALPVLEDWDLWLRVFRIEVPERVPRVTAEVRRRWDGSRLTQQYGAQWLENLARVYAKTIDLELEHSQLREIRRSYLVQACARRKLPFPRRCEDWLEGRPGVPRIDAGRCQAEIDALGIG